jgi:hypothetical protein
VFFSGLSLLTFIAGLAVGIPPLLDYLELHLVYKVPSAILSAALMILSMLFFCCGLILDTVVRIQRENYELMLTQSTNVKTGMLFSREREGNCSSSPR